jgi:hypothetical protein
LQSSSHGIDLSNRHELKASVAKWLEAHRSEGKSEAKAADSKAAAAAESKSGTESKSAVPVVHCLPHMDTNTCVYIVSCPNTKRAVVIDCCLDFDQVCVRPH